jgi:LPXTG-motif cell wall-anchored protein
VIKRFVLVGSAVAVATLGLALPVNADYPPGGSVVVVDDPSVPSGTPVEISADVCPAGQGQDVTFTISPPGGGAPVVLHAIADELGHAVVSYTPAAGAGAYAVDATTEFCDPSETSFAVESPLPVTGSDSNQWVVTGTALVLIGGAFSVVAFRRRHAAA